jgi:hypothetical protein
LCSRDVGCHVGSLFVGALAYADDLVLIALSANAVRLMLQVCDDYATEYNVSFNASILNVCVAFHLVLLNIYSIPSTLFRSILDLRQLSSWFGLRRIWKIPNTMYSTLLPRLSNTMPLLYMFHKRILKFVHRRLTSDSPLVTSFITQTILFGQANSIIGRNVLTCCSRYHVAVDDIMTLAFGHHNIDKLIIQSNQNAAIDDWLIELVYCRDGMLHLSGNDFNMHDIL